MGARASRTVGAEPRGTVVRRLLEWMPRWMAALAAAAAWVVWRLLRRKRALPAPSPERLELEALGLKELRARARSSGVSAELLEDAACSDDPKPAMISILLDATAGGTEAPQVKPHFSGDAPAGGSADALSEPVVSAVSEPPAGASSEPPDAAGSGHAGASARSSGGSSRWKKLFGRKHCMISYNWGVQDAVLAARQRLAGAGVPTWMDVDGASPLARHGRHA